MSATAVTGRGDVWRLLGRALALLLSLPVHLYRLLLRPLLPKVCRFHPSCSTYALLALERHGPLRGLWLSASRIVRCRPGLAGGFDPVPGEPEGSR